MEKNSSLISAYREKKHEIKIFMQGVERWFAEHPKLTGNALCTIHSVKSRLKDEDHLLEKITRKLQEKRSINSGHEMFSEITDLAGVRVLLLHQEQFKIVHKEIMSKINDHKDWVLPENPKAYTWDPESKSFFSNMDIHVEVKDSFYTSVHYIIRPRHDSPICCEIQVRTLFEEIWGEVDHQLNYPSPSDNLACREQLKVLAKLVGAGSRLVDSIFKSVSPP